MNVFRLIRLLALERFSPDTLLRAPEPSLVMDGEGSVDSFDRQGTNDGPLLPLYHFNALGISRLLPEAGRLLDLGSGSGRLLAYLASARPDTHMTGIELSPTMVETANRMFEKAGLSNRVRLEVGDMTDLQSHALESVDVISMNLALEHLPDFAAVESFVRQLRVPLQKHGCGFWLFNHTRPRTLAVASLFPEVFTPDAPHAFRQDSRNSLIASWRFSELAPLFRSVLGDRIQGRLSRLLPLYQVFWIEPVGRARTRGVWRGPAKPDGKAGKEFGSFRSLLFPDVPLDAPLQGE